MEIIILNINWDDKYSHNSINKNREIIIADIHETIRKVNMI